MGKNSFFKIFAASILLAILALIWFQWTAQERRDGEQRLEGAGRSENPGEAQKLQLSVSMEIPALKALSNEDTPPASPKKVSPEEYKKIQELRLKYRTGDYHGSLDLINSYRLTPKSSLAFKNWLKEQFPGVLTAAARLFIETGDCEGALPILEQVRKLRTSQAVLANLAFCYHKLRLWPEAKNELEAYIKRWPEDVGALGLYADTLESHQQFAEAVDALLQAKAMTKDAQILSRIETRLQAMQKKAAQAGSQDLSQSRNFTLLLDGGGDPGFADWVLGVLEEAHEELMDRWSMRALNGRVEVVFYGLKVFRDIMSEGPHWMGGAFDGRIRVPVAQNGFHRPSYLESIKATLRHELVHAVFFDMTGRRRLPSWFEEGFAQRFTCTGDGCKVLQSLPTRGKFFGASQFNEGFIALDSGDAQLIYKQSLYLILSIEAMLGTGVLNDILASISHRGPLDSNTVLAPAGLNFPSLLQFAKKQWQKGVDLPGQPH